MTQIIRTEFLCRVEVTLEAPRELGNAPLGRRRIIGITGGSFSGPRFSGRVLPGGADWQLVRADGVAYLDARYTLETADGVLVYVRNRGYRHGPADAMARIARGEPVDPALIYARTTPWFETSDSRYDWLNRTVFVGSAVRRPAAVELEFHAVQ